MTYLQSLPVAYRDASQNSKLHVLQSTNKNYSQLYVVALPVFVVALLDAALLDARPPSPLLQTPLHPLISKPYIQANKHDPRALIRRFLHVSTRLHFVLSAVTLSMVVFVDVLVRRSLIVRPSSFVPR